jgi:hypothetical protein
VLGNQRSAAAYCLSNASGGSDKDCDRLFNLSDVRPGQPQQIDLTLWNVDPDSDTDAEALRLFGSSCTSGIANPSALAGSGNLCDGLELTVRRYDTSARLGAGVCIIGCDATANTSLTDLAQNHGSFATGASLDTDFRVNERAYLVVTITLPDTGATSDGRGRDNRYLNRTAAIALTWQMLSA